MAIYFLNSEWAALTAGTVVEVTGGTAVIGTDAFASAEGLTVAAGDTVAYEGGIFASIVSAEGVTAQINKNIVYTGEALTLSGITVNADTIDTAKAAITAASDVNYGMVTVLGGTTAGGYVVDGDLYIKNNVYYNNSAFTEATTTVDVGGATFSGTYGTNIFAETTAADIEELTGPGKVIVMSGTYDVSGWGDVFFLRSDAVIIENAKFTISESAAALHVLRSSESTEDRYAAVRNVTIDKNVLTRFSMLYLVNTESDVTIDLENVYTARNIDLTRSSATVGNLTLNVIGGSFSAITDRQNLTVNGTLTVNLLGVNTTGNVAVLSNNSKADNLCITLDNCVSVGNIIAYQTTGVLSEGGVAALIVKGANTAVNISAFDTITIYADGGEKASLTAKSIDFNGTVTVDLANVTKSGTFKVIDITGSVAQNWNVEFVNAGYSSATYETVDNDLVISVDYVSVDKVYVNNNWKAEDADANGLITLANGSKAVWGVNAFNDITAAKEAAGEKPICIDGGIYNSEIDLTELVITGDVTITDWTDVTSVIVKNGATITTDKWNSAIKLTVDLSDAVSSDPVINYIGSDSVDYGMVSITGGTTAGGYVVDGDLYIKNNVYYNDSTFTEATTTVDVGGATFSGTYGTNIFNYTVDGTVIASNATLFNKFPSESAVVFSGNINTDTIFAPSFNTIVIKDGKTVGNKKQLRMFHSVDGGDLHGVMQNFTLNNNANGFVLIGGGNVDSVTIDLIKSSTTRLMNITGDGLSVQNDFILNLSSYTINNGVGTESIISGGTGMTMIVGGTFALNLTKSTLNKPIDVLNIAGATVGSLAISLTDSTVNNIVGRSAGTIAEGGNAILSVNGNNTAADISGFDAITIYADGGDAANLTATNIDFNGTITVDLSNVTKSGTFKVIDIAGDVANNWNVEFVNAGYSSATYETVENDLVISVDYVAVDTDSVYVNSNWTAADADAKGLIVLANGSKAIWGVNAFNNTADAKEAAGDKAVVIEGGSYSSLSGLTELVITGDVTITDWTGVTSVIVKNGATITTDKWNSAITLTIEAAGNNFSAPVINYVGSGSVSFGDVTVTGDAAVKSVVIGNKLYAGSDIVYNDSSLAGKMAGDVVTFTINGETFSGIYGKNVYSFNGATVSDLNSVFAADRLTVLSGSYDISNWGSAGYSPKSNVVIVDGATFFVGEGTNKGRFSLFATESEGDLYGVIRDASGIASFGSHFYLLHGAGVDEQKNGVITKVKNVGDVNIDLENTTFSGIRIVRSGSDIDGDFALNVKNSTVGAITDYVTLDVAGDISFNVTGSTVGDVTLLSASASTASNLSVTIDNSTIGSLSGYNSKVEAASLTVKGISITGAISGFDYITISAGATLTATSITHAGTITIDVAGITESVKVIDGSATSTYGDIVLVNKGDAIVNVRVGEDNDVYLDVIRVITDTVYVNSTWSSASANENNLITLSDGNQAVWGVNAFATVSEAAAAANGKPIAIDGGVYNDATGLTDLTVTGDATINDWSGVTGVTVKNGATVTTNNWSGTIGFNVDAAKDFDAAKPVINYTGSGEVTFGKVNFVNGSGAAYAVGGKLYAGSNVIYNNPAYTADTEIVLGGVTFTGVYGENIFNYTNVNDLNSITGADKVTVFTGSYASTVWSASGFNPAGNITVFDGATVTTNDGQADWTNRIYLARNDRAGADIYGAVLNSDMSKTAYFYAMYNVVNGGDMTVDIANSKMYNLYLMRGTGDVDNLTINVTNSEFVSGISDTGHIVVDGELVLNITGSTVGGNINLMQAANTNISKITVSITDSTVGNVYASSAGKAEIGQDELILNGTVYAGTIDNFETVTITAGAVVDAHKINTGTLNVTLGEITEDICIIDTDTFLRYGTLNVTNAGALPAGFELIEFNGDLWAVNTSDPTKVIGREVTVNEVAVGDAFEGVTITDKIFGTKADAGEVDVEFSMKNTVAKSIVGGGSNANAAIDTIKINLNDTTFDTFYGGGYNAETGTIETELNGVRAMKMVYGGNVVNSNKSGNSTDSTVGSVSLTIKGGRFEDQVVGGGRVVASAGSTTAGDVCSTIGEVVFTVKSDEKGFSAVFNDSIFGAGYVIGNHSEHRAELSVGGVTMELNGASMNSNGKPSHGIYAGGMASGNASITVGTNVQTFAVVEADEAVYLSVVSGSYTSIYGGGWAEKGASVIVKGVAIEVTGGDIENLYGGGNNDQSGARTFIDGDVFITISGGSIDNVYAGAKFVTSKVKGSSTIQITGNATIGTLCGLTSNGYDSVLEEQILDVDAAFSCKSISGFDVIDIAAGASVTLVDSEKETTLSFDFGGVDLVLGDYYGDTDWTVMTAEQLTNLSEASSVTLNGQEATWNGSMFASADYMLSIQENTVKNQTTYSLVFGKLA